MPVMVETDPLLDYVSGLSVGVEEDGDCHE